MSKIKALIVGVVIAAISLVSTGAHAFHWHRSNESVAIAPQYLVWYEISGVPSQVNAGQTYAGLTYTVTNTNPTDAYTVAFSGLQSKDITYTTNCANLPSNATCTVTINYVAPLLPDGVPSQQLIYPFKITGGPRDYPQIIQTKDVSNPSDIAPKTIVTFDTAATDSSTFNVTFTPATGDPTVYTGVPFGTSGDLSPALPPARYTVSVTPSTTTGSDSNTYKSPAPFGFTLSPSTKIATIPYKEQPAELIAVSTNLITPDYDSTIDTHMVEVRGSPSYEHTQAVNGVVAFDNMEPGSYTVTVPSYTVSGTTYNPILNNPYPIDKTHTTVSVTWAGAPPPGSNYDWHASHLTAMKNANVFAVWWGGGNTTAPIQTSTNPAPNPKLVSDIASYESSPTTILESAAVEGFPNYIAQGTISEPTGGVTDQLKLQHLDIDNKYEAPFGNSPGGCYYQQQNASGASSGNQKDYWYNANQPAGTNALNWTTTPSTTNLIPAGTYIVAGDQYVVPTGSNRNGFVQYIGKIGTPVQVDSTHVTIPETYIALPPNTSQGRPNLANNQTVTFTVPTYVSTNVTFGAQPPPHGAPPAVSTSLINLAENMCGSYSYTTGGYTPIVNDIAAQALAVKTATGHNLVAGDVFYTVPASIANDSIIDSLVNDYNVESNLYNLAIEAQLMQNQYTTNGVNMALLLNPDSTNFFQNCSQWNCAISWQKGLTLDTSTTLIQIPNMQADIDSVIDRMVLYGQLSSGAGSTLKALIVSSNVLTPPSGSGLTSPGMQNFFLLENLIIKQLAPNIPFGYGNNLYDNNNPIMAVGTPPVAGAPWETASITWIHKVNHLGYTPTVVSQAIQFEANKYSTFLKAMNFANYSGNPYSAYEPNFIYFDRYEHDVIYGDINNGYLLNGVDWDSYISQYLGDMNDGSIISKIPVAMWQMPGSSLQVEGATWPSNAKGDDMVDWTFGNPDLNNDFSNIDACTTLEHIYPPPAPPGPYPLPCNWYKTDFTGFLNTSVYYTNNSQVKNTIDYLKLTSSAP